MFATNSAFFRSRLRVVALIPLAVMLSACCFSTRASERFAGSADVIPLPDGLIIVDRGNDKFEVLSEDSPEGQRALRNQAAAREALVAGAAEELDQVDDEVVVEPVEQPVVAAEIPDRWRADFERLGSSLYFDFDVSTLTPGSVRILRGWTDALKEYPQVAVTVNGHTDARGPRDYNLWLGERRAQSIADFLEIRGIDQKRIRVVSYGEEALAVRGNSDRAHALNRRVEMEVRQGSP
ncbi:MAG: OmpA family protein [Gammaproteobacteria bacterium]